MRFPIRFFRFLSLLFRLLVPALLLFVLYVFSLVVLDSFYSDESRTQLKSDEEPPPIYNLMEETYGRKWANTPEDKYFSPADCTEGI